MESSPSLPRKTSLHVVYQIVKASGGTMRFVSEVGKGTTFFVSYPLKGMSQKEGDAGLT